MISAKIVRIFFIVQATARAWPLHSLEKSIIQVLMHVFVVTSRMAGYYLNLEVGYNDEYGIQ